MKNLLILLILSGETSVIILNSATTQVDSMREQSENAFADDEEYIEEE